MQVGALDGAALVHFVAGGTDWYGSQPLSGAAEHDGSAGRKTGSQYFAVRIDGAERVQPVRGYRQIGSDFLGGGAVCFVDRRLDASPLESHRRYWSTNAGADDECFH